MQQEEKKEWFHRVTPKTSQEEMRKIFKKACLALKWPIHGWKSRLARKIGVNNTVFIDWINGGRRLKGKPLQKIIRYINENLPRELPHIAKYYADSYRKNEILVTDLADNVDNVVNFIKKTDGAVVVNDPEINHIVGILTSIDASKLRRFESRISAAVVHKVTLKELYYRDKLFSRESKGRDFSVRRWDDSIESILSDLKKVEYVIVKEFKDIVCICRRPPRLIRAPAKEHVKEYFSNNFLYRVATKLVRLIPNKKFKKNGLYLDVATGTGSGAKAILSHVTKIFGEKHCGKIVAAENNNQASFYDLLSREVRDQGLNPIELSFQNDGRKDLSKHLKDRAFDIIIWNCILPEKEALSHLDYILAEDGAIAISHYDRESLNNVYQLIIDTFSQQNLYLEMPKSELLNILELRDLVSTYKELVRKFKWILHQEEIEAHFSTPRDFINYLHCFSPFSAGCFALLKNSAAREDVFLLLENEIKDKYGSVSLKVPFIINFVIGLS